MMDREEAVKKTLFSDSDGDSVGESSNNTNPKISKRKLSDYDCEDNLNPTKKKRIDPNFNSDDDDNNNSSGTSGSNIGASGSSSLNNSSSRVITDSPVNNIVIDYIIEIESVTSIYDDLDFFE